MWCCCATVKHFPALHLLSIWDMIARWKIPMPTKGSCLNFITSGFNKWKVTSIIPFKAKFLCIQYFTLTGLHQIKSSTFRSAYPPENHLDHFLAAWGDSTMDNMRSSSRICDGDTNKVQRSAWLGWLCWRVHPGCQTDWWDPYFICQSDCWTGTCVARK